MVPPAHRRLNEAERVVSRARRWKTPHELNCQIPRKRLIL